MVNPSLSPDIAPLLALLREYSFDIDNYQPEVLISQWLEQFDPIWVGHAITEALYQGRYKVVSVDYILQLWQRRGAPLRHFNREFESIILGQTLLINSEVVPEPAPPSPQASPTVKAPEAFLPWPQPDRPELIPNFRPLGELAPGRAIAASIDPIPPFVPRPQTTDLYQRLRSVVHSNLSS